MLRGVLVNLRRSISVRVLFKVEVIPRIIRSVELGTEREIVAAFAHARHVEVRRARERGVVVSRRVGGALERGAVHREFGAS